MNDAATDTAKKMLEKFCEIWENAKDRAWDDTLYAEETRRINSKPIISRGEALNWLKERGYEYRLLKYADQNTNVDCAMRVIDEYEREHNTRYYCCYVPGKPLIDYSLVKYPYDDEK